MAVTDWGQRFRAYLVERPEGISDQEHRAHVVARAAFPGALLSHVVFLIIFWQVEAWPLVWFNVASIAIFTAAVWFICLRNRFAAWPFVLANLIEIPGHGLLATLWFGLEPAFNFFIVNSVVVVMILPFFSRITRVCLSLGYLVMLTASGVYVLTFGAVDPQGPSFNILFFAANTAMLSSVMALCMGLYEWAACMAERDLVASRSRTEASNRTLENVSSQLAKYISPQLYSAIVSGQQQVKVDSKRKKLTVFFSDIVGFTETTDQLESEELTALLNEYLTEMSLIAQAHGANFDKFIGDAIVLYFGDPETQGVKEDAAQCVRMAIAMQQHMQDLRQRWLDLGLERPFEMRIGINTGYCTVGNFGSIDRMDYTIIGGEVNLAARLEAHADTGGILLSHETWSLVNDWAMAEEVAALDLKGISRPVRAYRLVGIYDDLAARGRIIHHSDPALTLTIDPERLTEQDRRKAITVLQSALDDLTAE